MRSALTSDCGTVCPISRSLARLDLDTRRDRPSYLRALRWCKGRSGRPPTFVACRCRTDSAPWRHASQHGGERRQQLSAIGFRRPRNYVGAGLRPGRVQLRHLVAATQLVTSTVHNQQYGWIDRRHFGITNLVMATHELTTHTLDYPGREVTPEETAMALFFIEGLRHHPTG